LQKFIIADEVLVMLSSALHSLILFLFFAPSTHATNILKQNTHPAMLFSSEEHVKLLADHSDVDESAKRKAADWCNYMGLEFDYFERHVFDEDEVRTLMKDKHYKATDVLRSHHGLTYTDGIFPLVAIKPNSLATDRDSFYTIAGSIVVVGGFTTYLLAGTDGYAAALAGVVTYTAAGLAVLGGLVGAGSCLECDNANTDDDLTDNKDGATFFAEPFLLDALYCK
jgi:hypothetical protein